MPGIVVNALYEFSNFNSHRDPVDVGSLRVTGLILALSECIREIEFQTISSHQSHPEPVAFKFINSYPRG